MNIMEIASKLPAPLFCGDARRNVSSYQAPVPDTACYRKLTFVISPYVSEIGYWLTDWTVVFFDPRVRYNHKKISVAGSWQLSFWFHSKTMLHLFAKKIAIFRLIWSVRGPEIHFLIMLWHWDDILTVTESQFYQFLVSTSATDIFAILGSTMNANVATQEGDRGCYHCLLMYAIKPT